MVVPFTMRPACPRCGYDQSGEIARWETHCPLAGRCSECGLDIEWRDVLNAARHVCPGHVEHAEGKRATFIAAWRTWVWSIWPWRLWKRLELRHAVRPRRLALWLAVITLPHALTSLVGAVTIAMLALAPPAAVPGRFPAISPSTSAWQRLVEQRYELMSAAILNIVRIDEDSLTFPGFRNNLAHLTRRWPRFLVPALAATLMPVFILLALHDTRSAAKIRLAHVLRAGVFSYAWVVVPSTFSLWFAIVQFVLHLPGVRSEDASIQSAYVSATLRTHYGLFFMLSRLWLFAILSWLAVYWWFALPRGLRVAQPFEIWVCMGICTGLLALVCAVLGP